MRAHLTLALIFLAATPAAFAGNFAECLLDKLPGVRSNQATTASLRLCLSQYPGKFESVPQGVGRGLFAKYSSGDECTVELAKEVTDRQAGVLIAKSCRRLYDEPAPFNPSSAVPAE